MIGTQSRRLAIVAVVVMLACAACGGGGGGGGGVPVNMNGFWTGDYTTCIAAGTYGAYFWNAQCAGPYWIDMFLTQGASGQVSGTWENELGTMGFVSGSNGNFILTATFTATVGPISVPNCYFQITGTLLGASAQSTSISMSGVGSDCILTYTSFNGSMARTTDQHRVSVGSEGRNGALISAALVQSDYLGGNTIALRDIAVRVDGNRLSPYAAHTVDAGRWHQIDVASGHNELCGASGTMHLRGGGPFQTDCFGYGFPLAPTSDGAATQALTLLFKDHGATYHIETCLLSAAAATGVVYLPNYVIVVE